MLMKRAILLAGLTFAAQPAFAHAYLTHAVPAAGSTVQSPPSNLELFYTEEVVPHFSSVAVQSAGGSRIHAGALRISQNRREVIVPMPKLAPGKYTVIWHMTAEDTHKTQGSYSFSVSP
jgi:copper resistance protein C